MDFIRLTLTTAALAKSQTGETHKRRITTINEYENATIGVDDGDYTCYVIHGEPFKPVYSLAKCQVLIQDLCEDNDCGLERICEADYDEGTYECTCNLDCAFTYDPLCSNRCELFFNPCAMREQTCNDSLFREMRNKGFCPEKEAPIIREIDEDIVVDAFGETVMLTSGVMKEGSPPVTVEWEFYPEDGGDKQVITPQADPFQLTVEEGSLGVYKANIKQCMDTLTVSEYRVGVKEEIELLSQLKYTCSVYPGGAIETFHSTASYYDLACTHALAADFSPEGGHPSWFIYGIFDLQDGDTALQGLTFYLGRDIFELQRGWIIHLNGVKMELEEGVRQDIPNTECSVVFANFHISVECPLFSAHYDGVMSGHITLNPGVTQPYSPPSKKRTNIGLCWDGRSGFRPNWQVGRNDGDCLIDTSDPSCPDTQLAQCNLQEAPMPLPGPVTAWTSCGAGAALSCGELHCAQSTPTAVQQCALEQAKRVSCALKKGDTGALESGIDVSCPTEECEWKLELLGRGCPQDNPPFVCVGNEIDNK